MKLGKYALFNLLATVATALYVLGCGGDSFEAAPSEVPADAQHDALDAGPEQQVEASPEAESDVAEASTDVASEDAKLEAGPDSSTDAPEEPPIGVCATQGHDGKIMVHPEVVLGTSAFLTVFGSLNYPPAGDAGSHTTPFEGWCWSQQGGQGTIDCFPKDGGDEAPATPGTKVVFQIGTTTGPSGPPSYYLCDFGVCPIDVVVCAGKSEACRWSNGTATGNIAYKEPGHNGKGELTCTLP